MQNEFTLLTKNCEECQQSKFEQKKKNHPVLPIDFMYFGPGEF